MSVIKKEINNKSSGYTQVLNDIGQNAVEVFDSQGRRIEIGIQQLKVNARNLIPKGTGIAFIKQNGKYDKFLNINE